MSKIIGITLTFLLSSIIISGCMPAPAQYHPKGLAIPLFSNKNECIVNVSGDLSSFNTKVGYSFTNKIAAIGAYYHTNYHPDNFTGYLRDYDGQIKNDYFETAIGLYKPFRKNLCLESFLGFGRGITKIYQNYTLNQGAGDNYTEKYKGNLNKYFLQIDFGYKSYLTSYNIFRDLYLETALATQLLFVIHELAGYKLGRYRYVPPNYSLDSLFNGNYNPSSFLLGIAFIQRFGYERLKFEVQPCYYFSTGNLRTKNWFVGFGLNAKFF